MQLQGGLVVVSHFKCKWSFKQETKINDLCFCRNESRFHYLRLPGYTARALQKVQNDRLL